MSLVRYLSLFLPLSAVLLLSPAATQSLLAEAPLERQSEPQSTSLGNTLPQSGNTPATESMRMSVQTFTPPAYQYQPLLAQPNTAEFWQQVGQNAVIAQDYANAVIAFDKALELSPDRKAELYAQRGWAHYLYQQQEEAIEDLQLAASMYLSREAYDDYVNTRRMMGFVARQEERVDNTIGSALEGTTTVTSFRSASSTGS